jgi:hypothetical protein
MLADFVRRRRVLRPLLRPARAARAAGTRLVAPDSRARRLTARAALLARAVSARPARARRRAELARALAAVPAPRPEPRLVSLVLTAETGVTRPPSHVTTEVVASAGMANGALVCFLGAGRPLDDGWLAHLTGVVHGDVVAATPMLVRPEAALAGSTPDDLRIAALGYDLTVAGNGAPVLRARAAGCRPDLPYPATAVDAGSCACFVVDRDAFVAAGGIDEALPPDVAIVDLSVRLRAAGYRILAVPNALVADLRPVGASSDLVMPFATRASEWNALVARRGPLLMRSARGPSPMTVAITTAAPSMKMAPRWGDWHFAGDLGRALRRAGHEVRLQIADSADTAASRSCDVHLVLHGLADVRRTPGQRHVLWVISHPETLTAGAVDAADLVFVASERFARVLRTRTDTPVETLLQATDHHRFRTRHADPRYAHPVVVVAKTRTVVRSIVADALRAGLRPAIYGSGWEGIVPPELIVREYLPNDELPLLYSSAGVVLNDHWDTMREQGFVSNRIFDVLACGTPVISDHLPEIAELFGDAVATYRDPDDLRALVDSVERDPETWRARASAGQALVRREHTFDVRAAALLAALERLGLVDQP